MRPEHVIILAAGLSRRMGELTRERPKFFLPLGGRRLIEHALGALEERGFSRVTLVVGYRHEQVERELGSRHGGLELDYVLSPDYASTGHGWSLALSQQAWRQQPVLLLHADAYFHPSILDAVLASPHESVIAVDERYGVKTGDEVVALGEGTRVRGFGKGLPHGSAGILGELVGVNRWSARFLGGLYAFMDRFFAERGRDFNYEPVLHAYLEASGGELHAVPTGAWPWINLNHPEDYRQLSEVIHPGIARVAHP